MQVVRSIAEVRQLTSAARGNQRRIGCVPTMGALHAGHLSLVEECRKHVEETILTIFVNPTQFSPSEDLNKYPRPLEADLEACRKAGVDCVYLPDIPSLYPADYDTWVTVGELSTILEGEFRPTHFRGVTTIVCKLLNIIQPEVACFGAKDYQQQTIIRCMVTDLNLPVEIVVCPTLREPDGLAMSSRNIYLSSEQRKTALVIFQTLQLAKDLFQAGRPGAEIESAMWSKLQSTAGVSPQYAVVRDPFTLTPMAEYADECVALIAAQVGQTRLIDNLRIQRQPGT